MIRAIKIRTEEMKYGTPASRGCSGYAAVTISKGVPITGDMAPVKLLRELTAPMLMP